MLTCYCIPFEYYLQIILLHEQSIDRTMHPIINMNIYIILYYMDAHASFLRIACSTKKTTICGKIKKKESYGEYYECFKRY